MISKKNDDTVNDLDFFDGFFEDFDNIDVPYSIIEELTSKDVLLIKDEIKNLLKNNANYSNFLVDQIVNQDIMSAHELWRIHKDLDAQAKLGADWTFIDTKLYIAQSQN